VGTPAGNQEQDLGLDQKQLGILASQLQAIFGRSLFAKSSKEPAIPVVLLNQISQI
jgi:hypothetical protein